MTQRADSRGVGVTDPPPTPPARGLITRVFSDRHASWRVASVIAGGLILGGLYASSGYSYLLFHNLVETATALVLLLVFVLTWNTHRILDNGYVLFLGLASLFSGILVLIHVFAYRGMETFPGYNTDLGTQFWIAFRYVMSASFLLAPAFIGKKVRIGATLAVFTAVTAVLVASIFRGMFPTCYVEGAGMTRFKMASEYVVSFILLAAFVLLARRRSAFDRGVFLLLGASLLLSMLSALSYTRYVIVIGPASMAGHFFELLATYAIYRAVVVTGFVEPTNLLFRNLKRSEEALQKANEDLELRVRERTAELAQANRVLEVEVAERKRAEARLLRLATAVEAAAEAVVITDPSGVIQYVNPAFEKITGYGKEDALGRTLHFLEGGRHDEEYFREIREALQQNGVWSGQHINIKKDGTPYDEECTISVVSDPGGEIANYVYIKHDVTEKKRLQSIAESVKTMESIGYVFSGLRHEIGNPINSLKMIYGVLRNRLDSLPADAVRSYLEQMMSEVARVEHLLRALKHFSLFQTQASQDLRVGDFLDNFLPLVKEDFDRKGIRINISVDRDAQGVRADPWALQQCLLNVLNNSADALKDRPDPVVSLSVSRQAGTVLIAVRDNGCGIPEKMMKNLYRPFSTTKEHGMGLGLVIVKKMLANMNGTIDVESTKDVGTVVTITVPESGQ